MTLQVHLSAESLARKVDVVRTYYPKCDQSHQSSHHLPSFHHHHIDSSYDLVELKWELDLEGVAEVE